MTTPTETPTPPLKRYVAIIDLDGYIAVEESPDGSLTDYGVAIDRIEQLTAQLEEAGSALNRIATESQGLRLRYFSRSSGEVVPPLIEDVANKALAAMQQKEKP